MKYVRYGAPGSEKPGVLDEMGRIRDLSEVIDDLSGDVLGDLPQVKPEQLPMVEGSIRLGPPVSGVGKLIGIGLNYSDHAAETGLEVPKEPIMFLKATSSITGPNDPVVLPRGSEHADWEIELAVVIGKTAKYVPKTEALSYIAGYTIGNDISERHYQIERGGQWTKGKSPDTFGPLGPWLVTPDEITDPQNLDLALDVNAEAMQRGNSDKMIFSVAHCISYLSHMMSLHPGDVILTGTPPGVGMGMEPKRYLKVGDVMDLQITGLGAQCTEVMQDT